MVLEGGELRSRHKEPSKAHRAINGHTSLPVDEDIPWSIGRLIIGSGAGGRLPIMPEVLDEAEIRGIELIAVPAAEARRLLGSIDRSDVYAITC